MNPVVKYHKKVAFRSACHWNAEIFFFVWVRAIHISAVLGPLLAQSTTTKSSVWEWLLCQEEGKQCLWEINEYKKTQFKSANQGKIVCSFTCWLGHPGVEGFLWLTYSWLSNRSCILCDEMGLGARNVLCEPKASFAYKGGGKLVPASLLYFTKVKLSVPKQHIPCSFRFLSSSTNPFWCQVVAISHFSFVVNDRFKSLNAIWGKGGAGCFQEQITFVPFHDHKLSLVSSRTNFFYCSCRDQGGGYMLRIFCA